MRSLVKNKRGGIASDLIAGTGGLVITVIIVFVIISTILGAHLLGTTETAEGNSAGNLSSNLTQGVGNVATKIPTILLIAGVVLLFGVIVILWMQAQKMGIGKGGGL